MDALSLSIAALMVLSALVTSMLLIGRDPLRSLVRGVRENAWAVGLLLVVAVGERAIAAIIGGVRPLLTVPASARVSEPFLIALQNAIPPGPGVPFFAVIYVLLFIFLLVTVPLLLLAWNGDRFRTYALALLFTYSIALASHALIGSVRPGLDPLSGVAPLLYSDPFWGPLSGDLHSRGNGLPSVHVAVVTVMCLSMWGLKGAGPVLLATLASTAAAVLYLGVHWPLDVIAGLLTGAASHIAAVWSQKKTMGRGGRAAPF
ncbi:MAG: phosphatase PAP2 family protein [Methanomassiliicoccus sp.]|nr:phosphatase PAP2 family protein [Methanomassiliicoccus sp.]